MRISHYILLSCLFIACEESDLVPATTAPQTFAEVFDQFWTGMNTHYVYWDIDSTDWNKEYQHHKNAFDSLDLNKHEDVHKSVAYFQQMTDQLIDGHFTISFSHDAISDVELYPLLERKKAGHTLHPHYSYLPYDTIYLDAGFKIGYDSTLAQPLLCLSGTIGGDLLYFSCNYFKLAQSYYALPNGSIRNSLNYFFEQVRNPETKGIIIDVRGNPGGDLTDLNFLLGHLIDQPLHIGYSQYKLDSGPEDYTPWIKAYVNPVAEGIKNELPVTVIADNYSASLAETLVLAVRAMPKGVFLGERTWGATGPIVPEETYHSGSFEIKNFMYVRSSSCRFKGLDHTLYESVGIAPDIFIPYSEQAYADGTDLQLEAAIEQTQ